MSNSSRVPNWNYWANQPLWTLDETYSLCEGMEPNATFITCDVELVSMVEKAIASGELPSIQIPLKSRLEKGDVLPKQQSGFAVKPSDFIKWAEMRRVHLYQELIDSVEPVVEEQEKRTIVKIEQEQIPGQLDMESSFQSEEKSLATPGTIYVPPALFEGRSPTIVREAMREEYGDAVIAYILCQQMGQFKTHTGKILYPQDQHDYSDRQLRNKVTALLDQAEKMIIVVGTPPED